MRGSGIFLVILMGTLMGQPQAHGAPARARGTTPRAPVQVSPKAPTARRQLALVRIQKLWAAAEAHRQAGRFKECGQAYEALAKGAPTHRRADAMLFNAGACYDRGGQTWHSIRVRTRLVTRYGRSALTAVTLYHLAGNHHTVLQIAEAASWYERFAARYPRRKEAHEALAWAVALRGALGQKKLMRQNVRRFILRYGRRRASQGARVFWAWIAYLRRGTSAEYEKALEQYLRQHARRGSMDRRIQALAELARIHWTRSCRIPADEGLCRRARRVKRRQTTGKRRVYRYVGRNRVSVAKAKRFLDRALKIWGHGQALRKISRVQPDRLARIKNALRFAAQARFLQVEQAFAAFLRQRAPRGLRYVPRSRRLTVASRKRYQKWMKTRTATVTRLRKAYLSVVTGVRARFKSRPTGDPHWALAALQRTGAVHRSFAEMLLNLRSPRGATPPRRDAALLRKKAVAGYRLCVRFARKVRWHNRWARRCTAALGALLPKMYPKAKERYPATGSSRTPLHRASFRWPAATSGRP